MSLACVILAAGKGKRLNSSISKVCHLVGGEPMLLHVLSVAEAVGALPVVVVVGHNGDQIENLISGRNVKIAWQKELLGTGDAVRQALPELLKSKAVDVLVMAGDTPLLKPSTIEALILNHSREKPSISILTCEIANPKGYGRVVRDEKGYIKSIIEEADASEKEKKIKEINTGVYLFNLSDLVDGLEHLDRKNAQGEYYLPKIIDYCLAKGKRVEAVKTEEPDEIVGVNSRAELAQANKLFYKRKALELMNEGVTIIDPEAVYIENRVTVGRDTIIYPFTFLKSGTVIGANCYIGPGTDVANSNIGDGCRVSYSIIEGSTIEEEVSIGPYARVRPGCLVRKRARLGSFVEIKKTEVGEDSKIPHLNYMGDAIIGKRVNIGAGSITCNFDGEKKHKTIVEDDAFIGSDTMFVAPVQIGKGAWTGAGSVLTDDVPDESLGIARPRQKTKIGWVKKKKRKENS